MVVTSSQTSPFQGFLLRSCNKYYATAFTDRLIGQKYLTNFVARIDNARSYKHFHHMESASATPGTPDLRPLGYKGPRADILMLLKQGQAMSVRDLAARLELSLNATRHHLKGLEDEGVVEHVLEHHGVGAPMHSYRLTAQGQALFPRRYLETLLGMLSVLEATEGRAAAVRILETHFDGLAQDLLGRVEAVSPEERLRIVTDALDSEGYMPQWSPDGSGAGALVERNCAIQAVAERYPEICAAEHRFLERVLAAKVDRTAHILGGCAACEYHVQLDSDVPAGDVVQIKPRDARRGVNA